MSEDKPIHDISNNSNVNYNRLYTNEKLLEELEQMPDKNIGIIGIVLVNENNKKIIESILGKYNVDRSKFIAETFDKYNNKRFNTNYYTLLTISPNNDDIQTAKHIIKELIENNFVHSFSYDVVSNYLFGGVFN